MFNFILTFITLLQATMVFAAPIVERDVVVVITKTLDPVYVTQYVDADGVAAATSSSTSTSTSTTANGNVLANALNNAISKVQAAVGNVQSVAATTPSEAAAVATSTSTTSSEVAAAPTTITTPTTSSTSTSTTSTTTSSTSSTSTSTSTSTDGMITSRPNYMVYSPFNDDSSCKDYNTINKDIALIKSKGISKIRVYGMDCNAETTLFPAAAANGVTIMQGLWIGSAGINNVDASLPTLVAYGSKNGWSLFDRINVGNEDVQNGFCTAAELIAKMASVKSTLKAAGYNGIVLTAEVTNVYQSNPSLCTAGDVIGLNAHSYFAPTFYPSQAGEFVEDQIAIIQNLCGSGTVFITETGYPHAGNTNGNNVPTRANQVLAVNSIMEKLNGEAVLLAQYDDFWKSPGDYNIEQYFGTIDYIQA